MKYIKSILLAVALSSTAVVALHAPASAQETVEIVFRASVAPPPLPEYDQPPIPGDDYLWTPGYWAWADDSGDYYWVPGTWVEAPEPGLLWTPGYWGYSDNVYVFRQGYWGSEVGFYGGVVYGFGYTGVGYQGGYWRDHNFFYNTAVNNVSNSSINITNVYQKTVINTTVINNVSYNGPGGVTVRPTPQQLAATNAKHIQPTQLQSKNQQAAHSSPTSFVSKNHGNPPVASTSHAGILSGQGIIAAKPHAPEKPATNNPQTPVIQPNRQVAPAPTGASNTQKPPTNNLPVQAAHQNERRAPLQPPSQVRPHTISQVHGHIVPRQQPVAVSPRPLDVSSAPHKLQINHSQLQPHTPVATHPSRPPVHVAAPVHNQPATQRAANPQIARPVQRNPQVARPVARNPPVIRKNPAQCGARGQPKC